MALTTDKQNVVSKTQRSRLRQDGYSPPCAKRPKPIEHSGISECTEPRDSIKTHSRAKSNKNPKRMEPLLAVTRQEVRGRERPVLALDFTRLALVCSADVPIKQLQICQQCVRFHQPEFACGLLGK